MKTKYKALSTIGIVSILLVGFTIQQNPWEAPPETKALLNPLKGDIGATKKGQELFNSSCFVCHGNSGKGDGPAGLALNPKPKDLTSAMIQTQKDGELFWKITQGKSPMAGYKGTYTDEQRWQLVNYLRELAQE